MPSEAELRAALEQSDADIAAGRTAPAACRDWVGRGTTAIAADDLASLIDYSPTALEHIRALHCHYEALGRDTAIRALMRALADAEARIERAPAMGLPAPRPCPKIARAPRLDQIGTVMDRLHNRTARVIVAICFDTLNIPDRLH
jgi:hypothetical protein